MRFSPPTLLFLTSLAISSVSADSFKRIVGGVSCSPVRVGSLALTDLDGNKYWASLSKETIPTFSGENATFLTTHHKNGKAVSKKQASFDFVKCTSTYLGYQAENPPVNNTGTSYYGHVLPATADQNSKQCLTLSTGNPQAKTSLFAGSVCNFNDNQSQEWNTFGLSNDTDALFFVGSRNGTKPIDRYVLVDQDTGRVTINTGSAPLGPNGTYFMSLEA